MIPPVADTDDPTSQIPWPAARSRLQPDAAVDESTSIASTSDGGPVDGKSAGSPAGRRTLSTWNLITLSIAMGGAQMAWTVELGWESALVDRWHGLTDIVDMEHRSSSVLV